MCKTKSNAGGVLAVLVAGAFFAVQQGVASATVYNKAIPTGLYGNVDQANVPVGGVRGPNSCGPTAVANSLQYLQTQFPGVYSGATSLIPAGKTAQDVAINLADNYMSTSNDTGTTWTNFVDGAYNYMQAVAPGKSTFAAQAIAGIYTGNLAFVQNTTPTFPFLYQQLQANEDIEIGLAIPNGGIGHFLTLASLNWNNANNSAFIQKGQNATMDFVDPAGGVAGTASIFQSGPNAVLQTNYDGGAGYDIIIADAQSPIPEPTPLALLAPACAGLLMLRRRKPAMR